MALAAAVLLCGHCHAQWLTQGAAVRSDAVETTESGEIDWGDGFYYASGEGVVPSPEEEANRARALLKAKGYAKMRAIANLRMAVDGTAISYKATGRDCIAGDVELRQTIEGYVANVEIVGERHLVDGGDTTVVVTVRAPMRGTNGIGTMILRSRSARQLAITTKPGDLSVEKTGDTRVSSVQPGSKGPFTSLIVDCSTFGLQRAMSPRIRRADGTEVWGTMKVDRVALQERGIAAYARTLEEAKRNPRTGSNPLLIKAIGRAGGRFMCDPVISDADADLAILANDSAGFLDKCNVVLIVD